MLTAAKRMLTAALAPATPAFMVAFALLLLLAPAARADRTSPESAEMLNVVPANDDAVIVGAVRAADDYWMRMGMPPRCAPDLYLYDDADPEVEGSGELGGCRVWMSRRARSGADLGQTPSQRRLFLAGFCSTVTHERGHNLGLSHESGWPIMEHGRHAEAAPTECWVWAKTIAPVRAKARASKRVARHANRSASHVGVIPT